MTNQKFKVFFPNTFVGFERLMEELSRGTEIEKYPPYNIAKVNDDQFLIEMAVAGFGEEDLDISVSDSVLTIVGKKPQTDSHEYIHHGISTRSFTRTFTLAEHVEVDSATFDNGILVVNLKREVPPEKQPKKIAIGGKK